MGFWIFMLIVSLLIPVTMISFGKRFSHVAPKNINAFFGVRTPMSMKNTDTWIFAHSYCGRIWLTVGLIMLPVSVAVMLFFVKASVTVVGVVGGVLCCVQIVPMIVSVILTEKALNRTFDKNGVRR